MKKMLFAVTFAAVSGYAYAQTPVQEPAQTPAAAEIKVEKIVTAAAVVGREPVNETSAFDKSVGRVYTWTKIVTTEAPARIKHIYYADDKKVTEIELDIKAKTYRVWSNKSVWPGNWKVEVTDEAGAVLSTITFTVAKTTAAETPKTEVPTQGK